MEKKTMDTLRVMLCGEIDEIAKKGSLSHETLDILKDLVETEKNLAKLEKYDEEKKEKEELMKMGAMNSMPVDRGYSQRKYYIDADYQPYGQSYARGGQSYMDGNSYARGGQGGNSRVGGNYMMYDMNGSYVDGGNSYMYYDPRYESPMYPMSRGRGYSRTGNKEDAMKELKELMQETNDEMVKNAISEAIEKMNR